METTNTVFPSYLALAHAYVRPQEWSGNLYSLDKALCAGTVFPELYQPVSQYDWRAIIE